MRPATLGLVVVWLMIFPALSYAAVPDYLKPGYSEITPTYKAKPGQPVGARLILTGSTPVPDEARLNISTGAARSRLEVVVNGELERYGAPSVEIPLPSEGVTEIEIFLYGVAPKVTKETDVALLDVKTYVKYKGEPGTYQEEKKLLLTVTNVVISEALGARDKAKTKLSLLESKIAGLRVSGADVSSLEEKLENGRSIIKTADALYEKGEIELSRDAAESAIKILDDALAEADKIQTTKETKQDIKKYGLIALGIIIIGVLLLLFRKRREELG